MNKQKVWKETKLQDICIFKTGKLNSNAAVVNGKYPFFTCSPEILKINSYSFDTEAVLLAGNNADRKFNVKLYKGKFDAYQRTYVINANENNAIINKYLYYALWLQLNYLKDVSMGTATKFLTMSILNNIKLPLPPLPEQRAISEILSSIDDKIELNNQMNRTLEAMAQAIFKQWFVDFKYPTSSTLPLSKGEMSRSDRGGGKMIDSELGPIPEGWRVSTIGEICDVIDCLHSKKPVKQEYVTGKVLLQLDNILDNGLLDRTKLYWISDEDYNLWISRIEVQKGDCLITNVGRSGAVAQIPSSFKAALGRNMTAIRCKNDFNFPTFLIQLLLSEYLKAEINSKLDAGTILNSLNVRNIPKLRFIRPPEVHVQQFEKVLRPIRERMEENLSESQTLSALRDSLLPKLMSGELRVPEEIVKRYENV